MAKRFVAAALALTATLAGPVFAQEPAQEQALEQSPAPLASAIKVVFVIAFENHDAKQIYGNTSDAPYINNVLMEKYAYSTNFIDPLPSSPSEPHYIWMEAGTNKLPDHTFTGNDDPSSSNSTGSSAHLTAQIRQAGISWMSYQEGLNSGTGKCPIDSDGHYAAKHNPFVFFRDVSGSPPSRSNSYCIAHHKNYKALADDLVNARVSSFNFITPNLCNDMHGDSGCPNSNEIKSGDNWLKRNLPAMIDYVNANQGAIFLVWDEGDSTNLLPFIAIGPGVKKGYAGTVRYDHSSLLKSVERILQLPILSTVSSANDFTDLFEAGQFP
jgi:phosphatidylinositol-3-phosphatase